MNYIRYPFKDTTCRRNGLNFTDHFDGSITVDGLADKTTYFQITDHENVILPLGRYKLSGCPKCNLDGCDLRVSNGAGGYRGYEFFGADDRGEGLVFNIDNSIRNMYVYIRVEKGASLKKKIFRPFVGLENASYTPPIF